MPSPNNNIRNAMSLINCTTGEIISLDDKSTLPDSKLLSDLPSFPVYRHYGNKLILLNKSTRGKSILNYNEASRINLSENYVKGVLSSTSLRNIKKHVIPWLNSIVQEYNMKAHPQRRSNNYIVMLTCTLPSKQHNSDKEVRRKILMPFIDKLKYHYGITHYFYRSEAQQNGNIHFHIIIDRFVIKEFVQKLWNETTDILGYLTKYEEIHNNRNAPSIKLTGQGNVKNIVDYVLKYCFKEEMHRKIDGRLYGMSDSLRELDVYEQHVDYEFQQSLINYIKEEKPKVYKDDFFTVVYLTDNYMTHYIPTYHSKNYYDYHKNVYMYLYKKGLHPYVIEAGKYDYNREKPENIIKDVIPLKNIDKIKNIKQLKLFDDDDFLKLPQHYNL